MTVQANPNGTRCGVFLCQCGSKIAPKVDLPAMEQMVREQLSPTWVETLPFPCLPPGLREVKEAIRTQGLNRVLVAGCEPRVMLKKLQRDLKEMGLEAEQIDMVNLRDHVALAHPGEPPENLAVKGSNLVAAELAGLMSIKTMAPQKVDCKGPVMILGGGMATYSAALELVRAGIDTIISVASDDPEDEIRMLHERYPGERHFHGRLRKIMQEVYESPHIRMVTRGEVERVMGNWGDYTVSFSAGGDQLPQTFKVGAIIAALDGEMLHQGPDFGHDGVRVLCHTELEEQIWVQGVPGHRLVFWVNDIETKRPWDQLSFRGAWNLARNIRMHNVNSQACILFNSRVTVPLSTLERVQARELGINLIQYDGNLRPTIQSGFITYNDLYDQIERELPWDQLVLSPLRDPGHESIRIAKILGMYTYEGEFLEREPQMVRPDEVGLGEKLIAGTSRKPCELQETLRQGQRAARILAGLVKKARPASFMAPAMPALWIKACAPVAACARKSVTAAPYCPWKDREAVSPAPWTPWSAPAAAPAPRPAPTWPSMCKPGLGSGGKPGREPWPPGWRKTRSWAMPVPGAGPRPLTMPVCMAWPITPAFTSCGCAASASSTPLSWDGPSWRGPTACCSWAASPKPATIATAWTTPGAAP